MLHTTKMKLIFVYIYYIYIAKKAQKKHIIMYIYIIYSKSFDIYLNIEYITYIFKKKSYLKGKL